MNTYTKPARVHIGQLFLFPYTAHDVCKGMGLNWSTTVRLHRDGFLSFNPETAGNLDSAKVAELQFLGSLVLAGCNKGMLRHLLRSLTNPYQYQLDCMYFDWLSQQWLSLPQIEEAAEEEEDDSFESWVDGL